MISRRLIALFALIALFNCGATIVVQGPVSFPAAGGGGGAPAFGGEITATRMSEVSSASTTVITTNRTCAVGEHIIIFTYAQNATEDTSGIGDAAGNTYASRATTFINAGGIRMRCLSAPVTTQLNSGSDITITWSNPSFSYRGAILCYATNIGATPVDVSGSGDLSFGTSCAGASLTTTAANTLVLTWLAAEDVGLTYSGGSFTAIGAAVDFGPSGGHSNVFLQSAFTSTGAKSSGGSWSANTTPSYLMVAFK